MGISEGLEGGLRADGSVGAIVWVRRRNGSWWPGRILGADELSASHLMSPRSGTPVKLLGREDASVDWYNLEKSKRVKAFRCGEFDDCIERAESSQGLPIKKREKYARREDAILHALELERQHLENKRRKLGLGPNCMSSKLPGASNKELGSRSSENFSGIDKAKDHCGYINPKSQSFYRRHDASIEEESMANPSHVQNRKQSKPIWEDDNSEVTPRMRGLQDLGLKIAPSKRKLPTSQRPVSVDNHLYAVPRVGHNIEMLNNDDSSKSSASVKRKRSQAGFPEESLVRRRDRRRPLVHVLRSTAKLPVYEPLQPDPVAKPTTILGEKELVNVPFQAKRSKCVYLPVESDDGLQQMGFPSHHHVQMSPAHHGMNNSLVHPGSLTEEYTTSELEEEQESTSSEDDSLDSETEEAETPFSDPTNSEQPIRCSGSVDKRQVHTNDMYEDLDETELSNYLTGIGPDEQAAGIHSDMGGSKWQLKGKRNMRNLIKRPVEDGKGSFPLSDKCNGAFYEHVWEGKGDILKPERMNGLLARQALHPGVCEGLSYMHDEDDLAEDDLEHCRMLGFGNRRYPSMLKASFRERERNGSSIMSSDEDSHVVSPSLWEPDRLSGATFKGYWEESDGCFGAPYVSYYGDRMNSMLIDVDLKVQASYQGERVPLVSLMSRLNGKAIVGHPVQIETLEDGSSDFLLSKDYSDELSDPNGNAAIPPVWRTARRTAMHRIPRPSPSPALDGEDAGALQYSDLERERVFKKPYASHARSKSKSVYGVSHNRRHPSQKKNQKKVSLSSQKTRTLSSIVVEQKPKQSEKNAEIVGLIKPDSAPTVTCVPVKLVFSRIREAVAGPPSVTANRAGYAERKPT